jgi:hypothetical protein
MAKFHNDSKTLRDDTPPSGRLGLPPAPPRKRTETTIQGEIIAALNRLPGVRVARNNVGKTPRPCAECMEELCRACEAKLKRPVAFGLGSGSPDVVGIYTHRGRAIAFAVEVKTPKGVASDDQKLWHAAMKRRGLPTFVARSPEEACTQVETWCAEVDGAL